MILEKHQRGVITFEDAEKQLAEVLQNQTDLDRQWIRHFHMECKRTVHQARKAGLLPAVEASSIELPTL